MWDDAIHKQRRARNAVHPWGGEGYNPKLEGTKIEIIMSQVLSTLGSEGKLWARQWRLPAMEYPFAAHEFDFAIPSAKLLIECDGCFVHGCPECNPGARPRVRDQLIDAAAEAMGWTVLRFWEHEIKRDAGGIRRKLASMI